MKTFGFIPSRFNSTRFPGKPLVLIDGKPMIQHVYERVLSCPDIEEVYVATDDVRISNCVNNFGGEFIMTDQSHQSGTDRICEAAVKIGVEREDIVINIQGDQPIFHPSTISGIIKPFMEDPSILMTTAKWRIKNQDKNYVTVVTDKEGFALYFSRRTIPCFRNKESNQVYYKHVGLYGFRMSFLLKFTSLSQGILEDAEKLEQLRALEHGFKIKVVETKYNSIDVDIPEDVKKVEGNIKN